MRGSWCACSSGCGRAVTGGSHPVAFCNLDRTSELHIWQLSEYTISLPSCYLSAWLLRLGSMQCTCSLRQPSQALGVTSRLGVKRRLTARRILVMCDASNKKVAIVTGASQGIGLEVRRAIATAPVTTASAPDSYEWSPNALVARAMLSFACLHTEPQEGSLMIRSEARGLANPSSPFCFAVCQAAAPEGLHSDSSCSRAKQRAEDPAKGQPSFENHHTGRFQVQKHRGQFGICLLLETHIPWY